MQYILDSMLEEIIHSIQEVVGEEATITLEPARAEFAADYAFACFPYARTMRKSPPEIAALIVEKLASARYIKSVVASGGFVNITLADEAMARALEESLRLANAFGAQKVYAEKTQVIETNNPNPFKDVHIGHAYNSIVADTLANMLELGGGKVHRVSYHGDVGLHVGKSMWAILKYLEGDVTKLASIVPAERSTFLSKMYVEGAGAYEEDPLEKQQIESLAKQSFILDDPFYAQVYETCKQWSFDYLDEVLATIGSKNVEKRYLERQTDVLGRETVESHIGDVFEHSEGAVVFAGEKYDLHTRVFISSQGTTLYEARDIGLLRMKHADFAPDMSYIVTAEEQREYFKVVLQAAALALPELAGKTTNIPHGTVKLSTGKMSSRTGKVLNIEWIFQSLREAVLRRSSNQETLNDAIVGALRYAMLKVKIGNDIVFDINEAVSLEGNSGPYLQYAHARGRSILAKLSVAPASKIQELTIDEHQLVAKMLLYPSITEKAVVELAPHAICTYLYELTQHFNRFYEKNRIIGHEREAERALIVEAYTVILKNGLGVLGIPTPERL